jgi:DNA modification methylase
MTARILHGDCIEQMRTLPADSVQVCVTSPPYWQLRDYGVAGQIGLEATPDEWVAKLVAVFAEVRRVLRPDGVLFVNQGDSYAGSGRGSDGGSALPAGLHATAAAAGAVGRAWVPPPAGLREKNLIGQPWRLAFALQADGWYWRDVIVWHKLNPMPSSVRDRCTPAWEPVLMFSTSARYFWDADAIKERASENTNPRRSRAALDQGAIEGVGHRQGPPGNPAPYKMPDGWATHRGGHGSFHKHGREKGAPAGRKLADAGSGTKNNGSMDAALAVMPEYRNKRNVWSLASEPMRDEHFAAYPTALVRPCVLAASRPGDTVLDPFSGSGTTGLVALQLGRRYVGCELNPQYVAMSEQRLRGITAGLPFGAAA